MQDIKIKERNKRYYNKYLYSITVIIPFAYSFRNAIREGFNEESLSDSLLTRLNLLQKTPSAFRYERWFNSGTLTKESILKLGNKVIYALEEIDKTCDDIKFSFTTDSINIFSNSLKPAELFSFIATTNINIHEAKITFNSDQIKCKTAKHRYRTFMKNKHVSIPMKQNLGKFFKTYEASCEPSEALYCWYTYNNGAYLKSNFTFDHDDETLPLMFALIAPGLKGKTFTLISDKYNLKEMK